VKNRWCLCDADGIENGRWAGSASSFFGGEGGKGRAAGRGRRRWAWARWWIYVDGPDGGAGLLDR
jgi:hypothetical protein